MKPTSPQPPRLSPRVSIQLSILGSFVLIALLLLLYHFQPFADFWTDKLLDVLILLAAVAAAWMAAKFKTQFHSDEPPRRVWAMFSLGLWFWVAGEVSGIVYDFIYWYAEYPDLMVTDLCWLVGYAFIGLALYYQYRLIFGKNKKRGTRFYAGLFLLALAVAALLTNAAIKTEIGLGYGWFVLFITFLYPVFDTMNGLGAIYLAFLFGRGHWIRPWWGLILFALSDSINVFYWLGGYKYLPEALQAPLNLIDLFFYSASYLVMAIAFLSLYYMSHYGAASGLITRPTTPGDNRP